GGMPMKILWAVLDVLTIIVLGSGVYLWWVRRRAARSVSTVQAQVAQ
ncbi:PepSY-associated TM helix, partial [Pseudomonas syringae pv. pisi str. 1704B]